MSVILQWALGVLASILAGTNILQFVNNRELRRKMSAEGYQTEIASLQNIIDGNVKEIDRLQKRCDEADSRYDSLRERYDSLEKKYDELRALIIKH